MPRSWLLAICGLAAFGVAVWFAGPLLVVGGQAPLEPRTARALCIALFCVQYLLQQAWALWRARRRNAAVIAGLAPAIEANLSPEGERLRERFVQALAELRRARFAPRGRYLSSLSWRFGRSYLSQLPWYMIIGAPGAGKTTALLNSGLAFPLGDKLGRGPVGGFGGTRSCDWWFTEQAVLIDTAGRYTTQESNPSDDRKAWLDFLALLRRFRPRRPLNGVLLSLSVEELLSSDPAQRSEHARILRARLDELQTRLSTRIPVYVILTKCDLLPGFMDWFGTLDRKKREQVFGVTFELPQTHADGPVAGFAREFAEVVDTLADELVMRMQAERDLQRRARVFMLLPQLRALGEGLDGMLRAVFANDSRHADGAGVLLRGVYLTSGTQAGTPIDRMLSAFGRELGVERQILPPNASSGKSFFLSRLLSDVVFAESDLNANSPFRRRLQRRIVVGAVVAVQACALLLASSWLAGFQRDRGQIARLQHEASAVSAIVQAASGRAANADPRALLPALNALRDLVRTQRGSQNRFGLIDVGSGAQAKLDAAARQAYQRFLLGAFQARIATAIDATLRGGTDMNVQYEALKAYAMLRDPRHFDAAGFKLFVSSYWDRALVPELGTLERRQLGEHLDALLEAGAVGSGIAVEPALIDAVRDRMRSQSGVRRLALRIAYAVQLRGLPDVSPGLRDPEARAVFAGADGKSAPSAVTALYTIDAFVQVVDAQTTATAAQLASEAQWVLGSPAQASDGDVAEFLRDYRAEYAQAWMHYLDDLRLKSAADAKQSSRQTQLLRMPDGPLVRVLREVVRQTPLRLTDGSAGPVEPLDPTAQRLFAVARFVNALGGEKPVAIGDIAGELPESVRAMLRSQTGAPAGGIAAARLGAACLHLVAGQFPFDRHAQRDASVDEFARLFAPGGAFDQADSQVAGAHAAAAANPEEGERARAAARIRDVFFAHGSSRPVLELTFKPLDMDEDIDRFELEIDGQTIRYAHGPQLPVVVKWPGVAGRARISATPATGGAADEYTGPWALLRLMDHAAIQAQGAPGHILVIFDVGGRHASFDVETASGANPFRMRELENFSCPLPAQ